MVDLHESAGPDPIDVQVGVTIRHHRLERGLSQAQLGAALGITFQQIQKYERGVNRISASMLVRAARVLEVQPSALLPRTDAEPLTEAAKAAAFVRGSHEVAQTYAAIRSGAQRKALLALIRSMGDVPAIRDDAAGENEAIGDQEG